MLIDLKKAPKGCSVISFSSQAGDELNSQSSSPSCISPKEFTSHMCCVIEPLLQTDIWSKILFYEG